MNNTRAARANGTIHNNREECTILKFSIGNLESLKSVLREWYDPSISKVILGAQQCESRTCFLM